MAESTLRVLFEVVENTPELHRQFVAASDPSELRHAVMAAGFDPEHPEIAAAIASVGELSDTELAATTGGFGGDIGDGGGEFEIWF